MRRALLALALGAATLAGAQEPPRVRLGTTIAPDTVTVGDPFVLQVRVQAPAGAQVVFPEKPDTLSAVDLLDPRRTANSPDTGVVDVTATYRLAAWDVGAQPLRLGDVIVRVGTAERRIPLGTLQVFVRSVLPADSAQRVPKPPREPIADPGLWWLVWVLLAAAVLALLALLAWLLRRWWLARRRAIAGGAAYREALAAFDRLDRLGLVAAGETGRHVALAEEILRHYLVARLPGAAASQTSGELRAALQPHAEVPHARLAPLLAFADLVKFAALRADATSATDAGREARAIVEHVERELLAREARERAEAAEREKRDREARKRYEQEQRRNARRKAA